MPSADRFKPYAPAVCAVMRPEEALPPDHPVRAFVDLIRSTDPAHVAIPPGPQGEKPYHPHALFGILARGNPQGVRSSRGLARPACREARFVYLADGGRPICRAPARFGWDNAAAFTAGSREPAVLAPRPGLAEPGHVALGGTKLKAGASRHTAMSYGRMRQREARLREEVARSVEQAEAQDAAEDRECGADSDGSSVAEPAPREARLAEIRALRERLEAERRPERGLPEDESPATPDKEQRSFADADARMMPMKRGEYAYAYDAQAAVDAEGEVIVAADLTNVSPRMPATRPGWCRGSGRCGRRRGSRTRSRRR